MPAPAGLAGDSPSKEVSGPEGAGLGGLRFKPLQAGSGGGAFQQQGGSEAPEGAQRLVAETHRRSGSGAWEPQRAAEGMSGSGAAGGEGGGGGGGGGEASRDERDRAAPVAEVPGQKLAGAASAEAGAGEGAEAGAGEGAEGAAGVVSVGSPTSGVPGASAGTCAGSSQQGQQQQDPQGTRQGVPPIKDRVRWTPELHKVRVVYGPGLPTVTVAQAAFRLELLRKIIFELPARARLWPGVWPTTCLVIEVVLAFGPWQALLTPMCVGGLCGHQLFAPKLVCFVWASPGDVRECRGSSSGDGLQSPPAAH
jgi:hypothetical protein